MYIRLLITIVFIFIFSLIFKKNKYLNILGFILLFICYGHIYFYLFTGNFLDVAVVDSILETNRNEMLSSIFFYKKIIILSFVSSFLSLYLSKKININIGKRYIIIIFASLIIYSLFRPIYYLYVDNNSYRNMENTKESHISLGTHMYNKVPHPFGDFIYLFFYIFYNENKYIKNESDKILNENIIGFNNPKSNIIIFIMGESSWKKRYSIYGYEKNTTPNMDVLFKQDSLGCVLNAYSQATITRDSIPLSFSFSTPRDYSSLTNEKSVIEIAKMQGYQTYWLSSQDISGLYSSKYGYLTKSVDHIEFTNWNDNKIPKLLENALKNNNNKFIILHLLGSHPPYTNFNKDEKMNMDHLDDYDLTINHTDKIVNEIFQKLRNNDVNFSLIYTSDHGEVVGKGHGLMKGLSQIEIPLLAYSNNNYNICNFYKQNKNNNGEINALTNKIVLLDMMGVELKNNYIKTESKNEDLLKPDGSIINYKNFK